MIEVTDEMRRALRPFVYGTSIDPVGDAILAVAPLIEAQARAEIEEAHEDIKVLCDERRQLLADLTQTRAEIEMWRVRCFAAERHMRDRDGDSIECGDICQLETLRADLAQARAEIETITAERNRMVDRYERLEADLAQALAAAIEEVERAIKRAAWMAKHACLVEPDGGSPTQAECDLCDEAERRILSLLSRPVSEREGADTAPAPAKRHEYNEDTGRMEPTDTAPAPAISGGMVSVLQDAYEHMTKHPTGARGWNALLNRMEAALAAADRSAS